MAKGFGIAALIAAVLGAFVPIIGFWIGIFALLLAALGALAGDRIFSIATICVSVVVFLFLTPSLWFDAGVSTAAEAGGYTGTTFIFGIVALVALCLPAVGIILNATGKVMFGGKASPRDASGKGS